MKIKSVSIKEEYFLNEFAGEYWIFSKNDYNNGSVSGLTALNGAFVYLWAQLEKGMSVDELINALAQKKNLDIDDAEADVYEFLARLINGNIVDVVA
ncbi:PqqD family protein [Eubacteriaceae bacterium ES3]|nr:PqqD family protein [Eubacteriaceae bacterium ES3]